jgi:K+-transporting ATPase ATPase C chain
MKNAIRSLRAVAVLAALTGVVYPLVLTLVAQVTMPAKADGSLERVDGRVVGSSLIGQAWEGDAWFYGRPSAAGYEASASSGSNLGPTSRELSQQIRARIGAVLAQERPYVPGLTAADVPVDLVTESASGLDPDISVAAAELQAPRIASVRGIPLAKVQSLIAEHTAGCTFGVLGEPRVNVLELNLALTQLERG